jgi:phospholipid/cholesterol/gamma-HCH transport system substrate-binding protein
MSAPGPRHRTVQDRLRTGLIVLLVGAGAFYYSLTHSLPFTGSGGRVLRAEFTAPNQVSGPTPLGSGGQTPVRVNGVDVGHVDSVTPADGGRAGIVSMRITDDAVRLHADATVTARFRTLLGAEYEVELNPGSPSAPPLRGSLIPVSRTSVQSEVDDVLRVFSGNTPSAVRSDLSQLGQGLAGRPAGALIDSLAPALQPTPAAFAALRGQATDDLSALVHSAATTTSTLGRYQTSLRQLISGGQSTFRATADERIPLARTLQDAPAALDATVSVSHSIEATLPSLDTLIAALRPGVRDLAPAARATRPAAVELASVLAHAKPLLRDLRPAVSQLAAAAPAGQALVDSLAPTVTRLNDQLIPYLQKPDSDLKQPLYELIAPTIATLGSAASEYDNHAHVLHFPPQPTSGTLTFVPCRLFVSAPSPSQLLRCDGLNSLLQTLLGAHHR